MALKGPFYPRKRPFKQYGHRYRFISFAIVLEMNIILRHAF